MSEVEESPLTDDCGHHCGVLTSGGKVKHIGHCDCLECHGRDIPSTTIVEGTLIWGNNADTLELNPKENINE